MKVFACVLLAVASQAAPAPEADPALLYAGYPYAGVYGFPYAASAVVTGNSVPVAVGGYKAVAGSNGDLAGPVHEVPGLVPALAIAKQESSGDVSLSTGTGAVVPALHYYGKREAEADPALLYGGYGLPYAGYPYAAVAPAIAYAVKPLELKTEVTATNLPVPVAVGGYKAVAGDNGDLKGAVHEVPGLVPAAALNTQENSNGGSLTVGTSAIITHTLAKRDADADPALLYGAYGYAGYPYVHSAYTYGHYGYPYGGYAYYG